jgi:hypothetical protein
MIEERHVELIHADLDGELAPGQRAELARVLLGNPEARALREELADLYGKLAGLESVAPPRDLAPAVLSGLAAMKSSQAANAVVRPVFRSVGLRYAAVFLGGLLASAALLRMAANEGSALDVSELVGTIGGIEAVPGQSPVDQAVLALAEVEGAMNTYRVGPQLVLELDLRAHEPIEIVAVQGGQSVRFSFGTPPGTPERVLWLPESTAGSATGIGIKIYAGGELLQEAALGATGPKRSE